MFLRRTCAILVILGFVAFSAVADEAADAGRTILEKYRDAVVTVQLVVKQKFSGGGMGSMSEEEKSEVTGTVIDPSGLTVLSLTATDPASVFSQLMGRMPGGEEMTIDSEVSDVKILKSDGTELPAQIVLRDKDLDLAFVRPVTKPAEPMAAVDVSQPAEPKLLDQLIALNRLGKVARRAHSASIERVEAIVTKPRLFYIPGQGDSGNATLGSPAFDLSGRFAGVAVMRLAEGGGSRFDNPTLVIILPATQLREVAQQAPEAGKAPEAKPEAAEDKDKPAPEGEKAKEPAEAKADV